MAAGAAVVAHQRESLILQVGVIHVVGVLVGRVIVLLSEQVAGDVARFVLRQAKARHGRHLLYLKFMAVVGALAVLQVEYIRKALALIILGGQVLLFEGAIRRGALA